MTVSFRAETVNHLIAMPFDHTELDLSFYVQDHALYAIGRLLTRLKWELKQFVLLRGRDSLRDSDSLLDILAAQYPDREKSAWKSVIELLNDHMSQQCTAHQLEARKVGVTLASVARQLPVANTLVVARETEERISRLLIEAGSVDVEIAVDQANRDFQATIQKSGLRTKTSRKPNPKQRSEIGETRRKLSTDLVNKYVTTPLDELADALQPRLNTRQWSLLLFGLELERGLCPEHVHKSTLWNNHELLVGYSLPGDRESKAVGSLLLFHQSRMPGVLHPDPDWPSKVRHELRRVGQLPDHLDQFLNTAERTIRDRLLDPIHLVDLIDRLHDWLLIEQNHLEEEETDGANEPVVVPGIYGEVLEIDESSNSAVLRRQDRETKLHRFSEIMLARLLIAANGTEVSFDAIEQATSGASSQLATRKPGVDPMNKLHKLKSRVKSVLNEVGLDVLSESGIGYRLVPKEAPQAE